MLHTIAEKGLLTRSRCGARTQRSQSSCHTLHLLKLPAEHQTCSRHSLKAQAQSMTAVGAGGGGGRPGPCM